MIKKNIINEFTLCPISRNYLNIGDKVKMKNGEILTIRSLEFKEFCAYEKIGYIYKKDIDTILGYIKYN